MNQGQKCPNKWWRCIEEFLDEEYEILCEKLTGMEITARFCHKKPTTLSAAKRNGGKTGVTLGDAKYLLNYLFNNIIQT